MSKGDEGGSFSRASNDAPPLYPDHCPDHARDEVPPKCGGCEKQKKANRRLAVVGPANPARVPHCGECDETRHMNTPVGVIRCPNCHPLAEEAS